MYDRCLKSTVRIAICNLNHINSINLSRCLSNLPCVSEYVFDFSNMQAVFPYGIVTSVFSIDHFKKLMTKMVQKKYGITPSFVYNGIDVYNNNAHGYAAHVGFFKEIGADIGRCAGEAYGSDSYIPIEKIGVSEVHDRAEERAVSYNDIIEIYSQRLASVIAKNDVKQIYG
ncbi:hypothetical protein [Solidesulfovibrio sp. C21]|uniref:hypothetical protein n=1 Tax=Solidesulfovibrio sp. C21 TaxID=3398613 RepID=UPI0039FD9A17